MGYREISEDRILTFSATPGFKEWEPFFTDESVSHPAKMNLRLLSWILETYTKPGDVVLDPMAGTGSTVIMASLLGRHGIAVELEPRFCDMIRSNIKLTERQTTLIPKGGMTCIQGDARELSKLLGESDAIVTSPPYSECEHDYKHGLRVLGDNFKGRRAWEEKAKVKTSENNIGNLPHGDINAIVTSPPYSESMSKRRKGYTTDPQLSRTRHMGEDSSDENIGNLPHGDIDAVITSPPYEGSYLGGGDQEARKKRLIESGHDVKDFFGGRARGATLRHYDEVDAVVTSPPYSEGTGHGGGPASKKLTLEKKLHLTGSEAYSKPVDAVVTSPPYEAGPFDRAGGHGGAYAGGIAERDEKMKPEKISDENIGSLKSDNYLGAMLQVYRECHKVLKDEGIMIVVTKNFIREKKVVRLDLDTIKLCEAAGFHLADRWYFKLPTRSFWRILYSKRFPDVPEVKFEDVLIFDKGVDIPGGKVKGGD